MKPIESLGWNAQYQSEYEENAQALTPARVIAVDRGSCLVVFGDTNETNHKRVTLAGKLRHGSDDDIAVGDWVALLGDRIDYVFKRRSALARKRAGESSAEQVIAANVDLTLIAMSLNDDFSPRRVERFVIAAWDAGTTPLVLLTKCDLVPDAGAAMEALVDVCAGCRMLVLSAISGQGIEELRQCITAGKTAVLVGSSGVGKSTLINALIGEERQSTGDIRDEDSKGRHTTTRRELLLIPQSGGLIIDTPGMREFGVLASEEGQALEQTFADVEVLASLCRFSDCAHSGEPKCAVLAAIEEGELSKARLASYFKLQRELAYNERRGNVAMQRQEGRAFNAMLRQHVKRGPKR